MGNSDDIIAASTTPLRVTDLSRLVGTPSVGVAHAAEKQNASEETVTDEEETSNDSSSDSGAEGLPDPCADKRRQDESASAGSFMEGCRPRRPSLLLAQTRRPSQTCGFDFDDLPMPTEDFSRQASLMTAEELTVCQDFSRQVSQATAEENDGFQDPRPSQALPFQHRSVQRLPSKEGCRGCRIAIVVSGTVGDVKPIIALALQLDSFGHEVRAFTATNLVEYFNDWGLDAVPIFADTQAIISAMGGFATGMVQTFSDGSKTSQDWLAEHKDAYVDSQDYLSRFHPHLVIAGILAFGPAFRYEAATGVPVVPIFLSYQAFSSFGDYASVTPMRPSLLCVSSLLETRSLESPPLGLHWTAECVLYDVPHGEDLEEGGKLAQLCKFLGTGRPPVAVGWGSVTPRFMKPVEMLLLALRALLAAGARGVMIGGWAELDKLAVMLQEGRLEELGDDAADLAAFASREVCFIDSAPHEWLFPQCSSIVHHGGVGTWQAAVRAGKPAVITPIFADQFEHAAATEQLGVGIGFKKPLHEVTSQELANAISLAEARASAAEAIGQKMRSKVGERDAAAVINDFVRAREQNRQ